MDSLIINHTEFSNLPLPPHCGPAVFETMRVYRDGGIARVPLLNSHLDRLMEGNALVQNPTITREPLLEDICSALVRYEWKENEEDALLRIILYPLHLVVTVSPWSPDPVFSNGIAAVTFEGERFLPQYKSTSALVSVMARNYATWRSAHEALLVNRREEITEGAWSNFFWVCQSGVLHTPKACDVLPGVTRGAVLTTLGEKIKKVEEPCPLMRVMGGVVECFITQSTHGIVPVLSIDGKSIGAGSPGEITLQLRQEYEALLAIDKFQVEVHGISKGHRNNLPGK